MKSEEQNIFSAAFQASVTAIIITNKDGIIEWANPAFELITGYTLNEALGKKPSQLISSGLQSSEFYQALWTCIEQGKPWQGIVTNKRKDKTLYREKLSITPILNQQNEICHYIGFKEDVTQTQALQEALMQSEKRFKELFINAPHAYQSLDTNGNIINVNKKWSELTGYTQEEVRGKFIGDFFTQESKKDMPLKFSHFIKEGHIHNQAFDFVHKNKQHISVEINGSIAYDEHNNPTHTHCVLFDMSEQKALRQERIEIESVFKTTHEGIIVTDKDYHITRINQAFLNMSGYSKDEILGKTPSFLKSNYHDKTFYAQMHKQIEKEGFWHGEIWNRKKNNALYPELLSINKVQDSLGNTLNYIGIFTDISKQKSNEMQLDFLAHHDTLTKLPNRLLLLNKLESSLQSYKKEKSMFALLLLDLDRFKNVNDSYGHISGDELLQKVANRLTNRLRNTDMICRLGGDEFAILLRDIKLQEDAAHVATQIISFMKEPWILDGNIELQVGVSIGISFLNETINSSQEMLQYADVALYKAKNKGGNNFVFYINEMTLKARENIELENRLRQGLANNELEVYLQAQTHIPTRRIIGAEALIRWMDPKKGIIYPDIFIPIAEESGLIRHIGSFVLEEACKLLAKWEKEKNRHISISINVSALQLKSDDFVDEVKNAILKYKINPKYLELELTESALMNNNEALMILYALRSLGVKLVIDDFGTGYSSLSYLKKFPLDTLKVDKSFIDDIPHDKDNTAITKAIVEMGHIMNFTIVAEGVETQEQLQYLQSIGCDVFQGYLESKPISISAFEKKYMLL